MRARSWALGLRFDSVSFLVFYFLEKHTEHNFVGTDGMNYNTGSFCICVSELTSAAFAIR
jgi:hypothetical protein